MRSAAAILALVALAGCAPRDQTTYWRDYTGTGRVDWQLRQDMAACENQYIVAGAISGTLAPGPAAWRSCMEARGWEQVR